jgi:hypothetical protein
MALEHQPARRPDGDEVVSMMWPSPSTIHAPWNALAARNTAYASVSENPISASE